MPWALAVVGMAGAIGGAVAKGDAARKAGNARLDAIRAMEDINIQTEQDIARTADKERFAGQLQLQRDVDPTVAAVREAGAKSLLSSIDTAEDQKARDVAGVLASENMQEDPKLVALKAKLLEDAQADLDRGAELPPEFQAELVRSGLETAGSSGFRPGAKGGAARSARTLLGAAGLALKEQRRQSALSSATGVTDMAATRANILSRIVPTLTSLGDATAARAGRAFLTASGAVPEYGLSGSEMVNLDLARINQQNKKQAAIGGINAEKAIAQGQMWSEIIGAGTQGVGSIMGGMSMFGGGGGGAAAAPAGGGGNIWG